MPEVPKLGEWEKTTG